MAGGVFTAASGWALVFGSDFRSTIFALHGNLMLDSLSAIFVLLIVTIGVLSNIYASGYLFKEGPPTASPRLRRARGTFVGKIKALRVFLSSLSFYDVGDGLVE